jgi:hypothetical protein
VRIPEPQALAMRRIALAGGALAATLAAHAWALGGLTLLPSAPFTWAGILSAAALTGPRRSWRPRGAVRTLGVLVVLQGAAHLAIGVVPWAAGVSGHAAHGAPGPEQLVPHAIAALGIAVLIARMERWLSRAAAIARRLRRWFAAAPRAARATRPLEPGSRRPPRRVGGSPRRSRGPPVLLPA